MKIIQHICMIAVLLILTAFNASSIWNLKVEDVKSIQVVRNFTGPHNREELDKELITQVVNWLRTSNETKVTGEFGKRPTMLKIKMNDGRLLVVTQAVKWVYNNNPDGSGFSQSSAIQDEILINFGTKSIQVKSPELFNWLTEITSVKPH